MTSVSPGELNFNRKWVFSNVSFEEELSGLTPATRYNVSVLASSELGDGIPISALFWTDIGGKVTLVFFLCIVDLCLACIFNV